LFVPYERGELSSRIYAQCLVLRTHATACGTQSASPSERRRHLLASALDARPDLLMLDEPTGDLDGAGIARLSGRLTTWRDGLLVVSHDRVLLRSFTQFFVVAESGCRTSRERSII
jgi:ATPase subunit of ABC transporter with duplicated ATPase domains